MPSPQTKMRKGSTPEDSQQHSVRRNTARDPETTQPPAVNALAKDLEKALELLKAKDDTSRFVGLALLKPVLEQELSKQDCAEQEGTLALTERCWRAIPAKFLDRLLKAKPEGKKTKEEAGSMVGLAVAIIHAFMTILEAPEKDDRFVGRVPLLMSALRSTPPETTTQIMQILATLATTLEGSHAVFSADDEDGKPDQKPRSYLFVTVLLIDIRSSIPSLQAKLHSTEYADLSERIARAYEIISAFIGFLVQSLETMDSDDEDGGSGPAFSSPLPIDLLMKLRASISEVMSLTIEHLRDRYDSSTAGAAGLHPSARTPSERSYHPLLIAWDTSSGISKDPLTLCQLRALSLWLRDEENDALRREAAGIMDVLLALYRDTSDQDFRYPVLLALEGTIETPDGVEAFFREEGWAIFAADLQEILSIPSDHARGIEIVRVLLAVVEADVTGPAKEDWMHIVDLARQSILHAPDTTNLELGVAICQLAVELMVRAPRGIRNRRKDAVVELRRYAAVLLTDEDGVSGGVRDGLEEVVQGLDSLSF
ncbi:MAG: hypothetical protein ASARMPREDX12_006701 [Alectoria sarmentosa]|nr:MAG: hypothetical protein ASARMPREDX12_006701 [Alectoria sarmentosa]